MGLPAFIVLSFHDLILEVGAKEIGLKSGWMQGLSSPVLRNRRVSESW